MSKEGLRPSARVTESDWLLPRLSKFCSAVTGVVPDGFRAYVRILHPAHSVTSSAPVNWAQVAAWSGRQMHRCVQFHRITQPLPSYGIGPEPWDGQNPEPGNLSPTLLRVLCVTLSGFTSPADSCWFCLWDGYGWLQRSVPAITAYDAHNAPRVRLPHRDYLLFEGRLSAATEFGCSPSGGVFFPQSPNLFWPQDRTWCVASEIDLFCTLVGGPESLAEALVRNPALEAWQVDPNDLVTYDSDLINI